MIIVKASEIIRKAENWLKKPMLTNAKDSILESDDLVNSLQRTMLQEESSKKKIGPLLGRVKGMQKAINSIEKVNWISVKSGHLSVGHRPSSKLGLDLKLQNTTHILTLLSEKEGGKKIQLISKQNSIEWLWFPMESANPPSEERLDELAELFFKIEHILKNKGNIYIHCSAGIHRTGMISYSFLRFIGNDMETSKRKLEKLRAKTSEGVGENRIEWGNSIYKVLKGYKK